MLDVDVFDDDEREREGELLSAATLMGVRLPRTCDLCESTRLCVCRAYQ
jgi:hypothetical protein